MQPNPSYMNLYPFGRLFPIIPDIAEFLNIKSSILVQNWMHAANMDDVNSMYSTAVLINYFKESQLYYRLPQSQMRVFGLIRSDLFIIHAISKLTKNDNFTNKKVAMLIIEILRFFITKFKEISEVVKFVDLIQNIIHSLQTLILFVGNKKVENPQILKEFPEYQFAKQGLKQFLVFIDSFEQMKKSDENIRKLKASQIQQEIEITLIYICRQKILDSLLATLIYINVDLLKFLQFLYEEQIQNIKKVQLKKCQEQYKKLHGSNRGIFTNLTNSNNYLSVHLRQSQKHVSNYKLFFYRIQPLFYYIPSMLLSCKDEKQKEQVFTKIFMKSMSLLNKLFSEANRDYEENYNLTKYNYERDFVRAFRCSDILTNIQIALIGFEQNQILEHKGVFEYKIQYEQILEYFIKVINVKNKFIQALEFLIHRHIQQWTGSQFLLKEIKNILAQSPVNTQQRQKQNTQAKKSLTASLSIFNNNKKPRKKNKKSKAVMEKIQQSNEQDQQTVYQNNKSKQRMDEFILQNDLSRETYEGQSNEEDSFLFVNMKPLQKMRQTNKKVDKSLQKSIPQSKNSPMPQIDQDIPSQRPSKSGSTSTISLDDFGNCPQVIQKKSFISYYQHHYHPYQSMSIFRQQRSSYLHNKIDSLSEGLCGQRQVFYPDILNTKVYQIKVYSPVNSKKIKVNENFTNKQLPKLNQKLNSLRTQFMAITLQYSEKQMAFRKSGKNSKNLQSLNKLRHQISVMQKQIIKTQFEIRGKQMSNGFIKINLFPLSETILGKITLKSLAQSLQLWIRLVDLKRKKDNGFVLKKQNQNILRSIKQMDNPFNNDIFKLQHPYEIKIQGLKDYEIVDYFFALVYDCLVNLFQGSSDDQIHLKFKEFHNLYFSRLDLSHKAIFLYYIYELERHQHFKFDFLIKKLVLEFISKREIEEILRFLIQDLKLQGVQMTTIYMKMYSILSENFFTTLNNIMQNLLPEINVNVKRISRKKDSNLNNNNISRTGLNNQKIKKELQGLKQEFNKQFTLLIDMLQVWMVMTFGVSVIQNQLQNPQTINKLQGNLLFYCPYCSSLKFIKHSATKLYNFQECCCDNCSNSLLHRFELQHTNSQFVLLTKRIKHQMYMMLFSHKVNLERLIDQNKWEVKQVNFKKYLDQPQTQNDNQSLFRTQTLSPEHKQRMIKSPQPKSNSRSSLSSSPNMRSGIKDQSFQKKINRIHNQQKSHYKTQTDHKNRTNNHLTVNSNANKPKNNKSYDRQFSNKKTQKSQKRSNQPSGNHFSQNKGQKQRQKPKKSQQQVFYQFNHEYCFNMERIIHCYFHYIMSLISKN